jgi:hypothetical protein
MRKQTIQYTSPLDALIDDYRHYLELRQNLEKKLQNIA